MTDDGQIYNCETGYVQFIMSEPVSFSLFKYSTYAITNIY